jgi:solute carrier family 50 (sugar transporter)
MWFSPLPLINKVLQRSELAPANPLPWAVTFTNCMGWLLYSAVIRDPFVFASNWVGLTTGLYFSLLSLNFLACEREFDREFGYSQKILLMLCGSVMLFSFVGMLCYMILDANISQLLVGTICCVFALCYYVAPASIALHVIQTKNSSSIDRLMNSVNLVNGLCWVAYGLAIGDYFQWTVNGLGSCVAAGLTFLSFVYPRDEEDKDNEKNKNDKDMDEAGLFGLGLFQKNENEKKDKPGRSRSWDLKVL